MLKTKGRGVKRDLVNRDEWEKLMKQTALKLYSLFKHDTVPFSSSV